MFHIVCLLLVITIPLNASNNILQVEYRDLANKFHILDNITWSIPTYFVNVHYSHMWDMYFGTTQEDEKYFEQYRTVRIKYQKELFHFFDDLNASKKSGYFSPLPSDIPDPIADAFYCSETLTEALALLQNTIASEDIKQIRTIFELFEKKISLMLVHDQYKFSQMIALINHELQKPEIAKNLIEIASFFKAPIKPFKSMHVFWAPENSHSLGYCYGDHLYIFIPHEYIYISKVNVTQFVTALIRGLTHRISSYAGPGQKQHLTSIFLKHKGKANSTEILEILEESLAIANYMRFLKSTYPDLYKKHIGYRAYPSEECIQLLEFYVTQKRSIDGYFVKYYALDLKNKIQQSAGCIH